MPAPLDKRLLFPIRDPAGKPPVALAQSLPGIRCPLV